MPDERFYVTHKNVGISSVFALCRLGNAGVSSIFVLCTLREYGILERTPGIFYWILMPACDICLGSRSTFWDSDEMFGWMLQKLRKDHWKLQDFYLHPVRFCFLVILGILMICFLHVAKIPGICGQLMDYLRKLLRSTFGILTRCSVGCCKQF